MKTKNYESTGISFCARVSALLKKSLEIKIRNYAKNTPDYPKSWLQDIRNSLDITCCTDKYAALYLNKRIEMYRKLVVPTHRDKLEELYNESTNILIQRACATV